VLVTAGAAPGSTASPASPAALTPTLRPATGKATLPLPSPAPAVARSKEEDPAWDRLTDEDTSPTLAAPKAAAAPQTPQPSSRLGIARKKASPLTVWWIAGAATVALLLVVTGLGLWAYFGSMQTAPPPSPGRPTLIVNRGGKSGDFPTLRSALEKVSSRPSQGALIRVQTSLQEVVSFEGLSNVTIEADSDKPLHWKAPPRALPHSYLLKVSKAADFHLKGFVLDGDNRLNTLVLLFHHCPGTLIEDVTFTGFKQVGCTLGNCEGGDDPDRHLVLRSLTFETTNANQAGLSFTVNPSISDIQKNRNIVVSKLNLSGPGKQVLTPAPDLLESCTLDGHPLPDKK
jgi:hypothetical protein